MGRPRGATAVESDALRQVLGKRGTSQEQLARDLGCSAGTVVKMLAKGTLPSKTEIKERFKKMAADYGVELPEGY